MSGTSSTDDLHRRADHEAGHFVAAHALGIITKPLWVTIQPRGAAGGSVGLMRLRDAPVRDVLQYYLGGIVGEAMGSLYRKHVGTQPTFEFIQGELVKGFVQANEQGGHGDITAIDETRKNHGPASWPDVVEHLWSVFELLSRSVNMTRFFLISDEVRSRETLYGAEALHIIEAHEGSGGQRGKLLRRLDEYRLKRKPASAPAIWFDGANEEQKLQPFLEGPTTSSGGWVIGRQARGSSP